MGAIWRVGRMCCGNMRVARSAGGRDEPVVWGDELSVSSESWSWSAGLEALSNGDCLAVS